MFDKRSAIVAGCGALVVLGAWYFLHPGWQSPGIRLRYAGKSISYWENQALLEMPQGNFEKVILPVAQKMGPEAIPFWLNRLQARDSKAALHYWKLWPSLPTPLRAVLPKPIIPGMRRAVAWSILDVLQYTNGIPELIQMSYSEDAELKRDAVFLLGTRAERCSDPSSECIEAFCSALKAPDRQTRVFAIGGLNVLPVRRQALPALQLALEDSDEEVRVKAAVAMIKLQAGSNLTCIFQSGMSSSNSDVRAISEVQLSNLQPK